MCLQLVWVEQSTYGQHAQVELLSFARYHMMIQSHQLDGVKEDHIWQLEQIQEIPKYGIPTTASLSEHFQAT
jgi:hypothetical protein